MHMSLTTQILLAILLLDLLCWVWVAARGIRRRSWKTLGHTAAYHALGAATVVMVLPFYWMVATSLKDFESANRPVPTWLPLGTKYYAPPPPAQPDEVSMPRPGEISAPRPGEISTRRPGETSTPSPGEISAAANRSSGPRGSVAHGSVAEGSTAASEIEVGLIRAGNLTWSEIRRKDSVVVAPVKRLQDQSAYYTVKGSDVRRERRPQWRNYVEAWNAPAKGNPENPVTFTRYFWVSGVTSLLTTLGTLITSILAAYAFAKMQFRGRDLLFYLVLATMMVPGQVLLIPNFLILSALPDYSFGLRWLDNYPALVVPWLASVFGIFMLRQFFRGIPDELWDAAQIDGAGRFRYLWRVMLPLSKPAVITLALFAFLGEWNSLLWPLIVTTSPDMRTLMVGLQTFNEEMSGNSHLLMAAATIAVLPVVILFFVLQRFFVAGLARTGFK
jgi:multiple sugar transport system permease protein